MGTIGFGDFVLIDNPVELLQLQIVAPLVKFKQRVADSEDEQLNITVSKVIKQLEKLLKEELKNVPEGSLDRIIRKFVKNVNKASFTKMVSIIETLCAEIVFCGIDPKLSFVAIVPGLFNGCDHRRCTFEATKGELYLRANEYLKSAPINMDLTESPSQEKTKDCYLDSVDRWTGYKENVDWIVSDLLNDLALNTPGSKEIQCEGKSITLRAQVETDFHRFTLLAVDDKQIYAGGKDQNSVCQEFFNAVHADIKTTENLTKLITQASLARAYAVMQMKMANPLLGFQLSAKEISVEIFTKKSDQLPGSTIVIKHSVLFVIVNINEDERQPWRYSKFTRIIEVERNSLLQGKGAGSKAIDYYSRFYRTIVAARAYPVELPQIKI